MKIKWLMNIFMLFMLTMQLSADENVTKEHPKYNETEVENSEFITLSEFDEWLKANDHYEVFVKDYNTSPNHPTVVKMKCLFELESLQSVGAEMLYDEMQEKCS